MEDLRSQLRDLQCLPLSQLIMAPEKRLPCFSGQVGEVSEFLSSMRNAFVRYAVPIDQRAAFLVDYLKDGPKAEVRALIGEGKGVEELIEFLRKSYKDYVPLGELQRYFLERKQGKRERVSGTTLWNWNGVFCASLQGITSYTLTPEQLWRNSSLRELRTCSYVMPCGTC